MLDDPRRVVLGGEPVRVGGRVVGRVTSGGFGYTVGASIAYAYLPIADAEPGTAVELDLFGEWVPGVVAARPAVSTRRASGPRLAVSSIGTRRSPYHDAMCLRADARRRRGSA